jgi:hypothetical protein
MSVNTTPTNDYRIIIFTCHGTSEISAKGKEYHSEIIACTTNQ